MVRWATSMVKVLAMMKTPTNSAIPAKTSSPVRMPDMPCSIMRACSSAISSPVEVRVFAGRTSRTRFSNSRWLTPSSAVRTISLYRPGWENSSCAVAVSNSTRVPPAATPPSSVSKTPTTFSSRIGPLTDIRTVSPTPKPVRSAVLESSAISPERSGARPSRRSWRGSSFFPSGPAS